MLEMERIGVMIFKGAQDLLAHPLDLRFGEFNHVVGDVVEQGEGKLGKARLLTPPQLIQQLRQFQNTTCRL